MSNFFLRLKKFFLTTAFGGLVILLPIFIFISLLKLVFDLIRNIVAPLSKLIGFAQATNELVIDLLAVAIVLVGCFLVGLFTRTRVGKGLFKELNTMLTNNMPFYGLIRETVQQFTGAKKMPFSKVVLIDPFGSGNQMIGFVADEHANGRFTIFVPTGPNPTNGFIFHVAKEQLEFIDLKPEEAMRVVIGVGAGASKFF